MAHVNRARTRSKSSRSQGASGAACRAGRRSRNSGRSKRAFPGPHHEAWSLCVLGLHAIGERLPFWLGTIWLSPRERVSLLRTLLRPTLLNPKATWGELGPVLELSSPAIPARVQLLATSANLEHIQKVLNRDGYRRGLSRPLCTALPRILGSSTDPDARHARLTGNPLGRDAVQAHGLRLKVESSRSKDGAQQVRASLERACKAPDRSSPGATSQSRREAASALRRMRRSYRWRKDQEGGARRRAPSRG